MYSYIKKNQKKFMAVFAAFLMVSFLATQSNKGRSNSRDITYGRIGTTAITSKDLADSRRQWEILKRTITVKRTDPRGEETEVPVLLDQLGEGFGRAGPQVAGQIVQQIVQQIDAKPELFYMLMREAEEMGTSVSNDQLQGLLNPKNTTFTPDNSPDYPEQAQEALRSLLLVRNAADRASDVVKVSQPARDQTLARAQRISLNLVEFKAKDYLGKLPQWSETERTAKVNAQYEKYKNEMPTTRPGNEFGFGYRVPNQSQVQYIEVPGDAVHQVVTQKVTDLEARRYFYENAAQFHPEIGDRPPVGVAAPQPPVLAPAPKIFTERSFDELHDKVYKQLIKERESKLTNEILADIGTQLANDYAAFRAAVGEGGPSTAPSISPAALAKAPVSSLGVPYNSYEYLQKLALSIQKKFGVLPKTNQDLGPRTDKQLSNAGDISNAMIEGFDIGSLYQRMQGNFQALQQVMQAAMFPSYATNFVTPLATLQVQQEARSLGLHVMGLYEPSPLLRGRASGISLGATPSSNSYIFRVVMAEAAHAPKLEDVREKVTEDAKLVEAYNLAAAAARDFVKGIPAPHAHLEPAATAGGKKVITTGLFDFRQPVVENLALPPGEESAGLFVEAAYTLLNSPVGDRQHPVGVMEYKPSATVFVGEINQVEPMWAPGELPAEQISRASYIDQQLGMSLRRAWFSPQDIMARNHYVPAKGNGNSSRQQQEEDDS
jgi:hypothetical protein